MAFDRRFLDELNARCDIVDIVSKYVSLKKSGGNYFGLCPFHNEKTPSFSVAPDKQIYHCFGCGAGGGPVSFIMKCEGLEYADAVRFLAKMYNLSVIEDNINPELRNRRERVLALCKLAARFFYTQLQAPEHEAVREYFLNRGLRKKTMDNFGLGFAPDSYHLLMDAMLAQGYSKEELFAAGLISRSEKGNHYDRFRNRVMFPIIDTRGNVIAFGGRVMDDSLPKYLNSPETVVFSKSHNLFALNLAKKTKKDYFILAEGYMDVIALHQAGFDSAVASLGTSLTEEQARLISRHTSEIVIAYDADGAGQTAAQRAIDILKKTGLTVKVLRIPGAKDPDQFIKERGAEAFQRLLDKSENHIEYRLESIKSKYNLEEDEQKVQFLREAARALAALDSTVEREVYAGRAAQTAGITLDAMLLEVKKAVTQRLKKIKAAKKREILAPVSMVQPQDRSMHYDDTRSARAEEGIISLIFTDNTLLEHVKDKISIEEFTSQALRKIFEHALDLYLNGRIISIAAFEGFLEEPELAHLAVILSRPPVALSGREKALDDYITNIKLQYIKNMQKLNSLTEDENEDPLTALSRTHREKKGFGGNKE